MNYNKLKSEIDKHELKFNDFAKEIGLSGMGLRKMIRFQSLRVDVLIRISEKLNIPITYWFDDDAKPYDEEKENLKKKNEHLEKVNITLMEKIDELKAKLEEKPASSKRAV